MGAPYFKAVCMGRALMIPGFVGDNIEKAITGKMETGINYQLLCQPWRDPEQILLHILLLQRNMERD